MIFVIEHPGGIVFKYFIIGYDINDCVEGGDIVDCRNKIASETCSINFITRADKKDYGKKSSKGIELDLNISRQELANIVGTTRETVIRALTTFKKEHSIDIEKNTITIIDLEKVKEWFK